MDSYAQGPGARPILERLSVLEPAILACMHGSAWRGAGKPLLHALADAVAPAGGRGHSGRFSHFPGDAGGPAGDNRWRGGVGRSEVPP